MTHHNVQESFEQSIMIAAPAERVWEYLTSPRRMKAWMAWPEMALEIETDWSVGSPIIMRGLQHVSFENTGTVLEFVPASRLAYTHLSSLSRLPDVPESYSALEFSLKCEGGVTVLKLRASSFPTDSIFKHLQFYWGGAMVELRRLVEQNIGRSADGKYHDVHA
jgi:uncharacterized protein YndB with AHSA1/START domain